MKNLVFKSMLLLSLSILLFACKKDKSNPTPTFELYINFWNPTGTNPQIEFDEVKTSKEIKIDFTKQFEGTAVGNLTNVIIDNFRIIDDNYNNYTISKITAYEFRSDINDWKEDVEFRMEYANTNSLSMVLVLDRSQSLGEDFNKVKEYAIDFVQKIFTEVDNVQMGVVDFSTDVNTLPLTSNQSSIESYINGLQSGEFTSMYDAIDEAIDMLSGVTAESKAILTFTDGTDNNSSSGATANSLYEKLINDASNIKISSFMIGLEGKGGVDKVVLEKLSVNGGITQFPASVSALDAAFQNFSRAIANVYNLKYIRNQQPIAETSPAKLKFVIQTHL